MKKFFCFSVIGTLIALLMLTCTVCGQEAEFVPPPSGFVHRVIWIGTLEGTWREMGIQYGQRASKAILHNSDMEWKDLLNWFENDSERIKTLASAFEKQIYLLSPKMIEFMEGIAIGAEKDLNRSVYADQASNYMRILSQQLEWTLRPWYEEFLEEGNQSVQGTGKSEESSAHGCNGWWVTGPATKNGQTYVSRHSQGEGLDRENAHEVAYVLIPEDSRAHVTFVQTAAGDIGGSGQAFNEYGVYVGWAVSPSNKDAAEKQAIGVPEYVYNLPAVVFSKSAEEAKDYILYGTPRYRRLTGRKTLLRARGSNTMVADEKAAFIIEQVARQYAVRTPGYLGEKGNSYLAFSNHFMYKDGSYDENGVFHNDLPMNEHNPEEEGNGSYYRLWSQMWWLNNNFGEIDLDMLMRDLSTMHYAYDKEGNKIEADPETGLPTVGTICLHDNISEEYPLGFTDSWNVSLAVPASREIYFIPAMPCQFIDHDWNYVDLKPYSEYRKAVYGNN